MVGAEGKSMLGEAAEKLGFKAREERGVGAQQAADAGAAKEEDVPAVAALRNRAAESRSPYVRGHMNNPVAWQLFGDEAIKLAKRENKLLFISIGYSACHWCHVMEKESFENDEVAAILNKDFIPIKIDREERPDIDRIYMNFVQATTGSGGWPLNVFVTPTLEPVFGGTYWHGPHSNTPQLELEDHVDFLRILGKLSQAWREQESRCRLDSAQILQQLKVFAAEGTLGGAPKTGAEPPAGGLDLDIIDEAYQHLVSTFDTTNSGFSAAPKFPTPSKLAFLLRLPHFPQPVLDVVGAEEVKSAQFMALSTLRAMARGGIHDHIGHGFSRYSVTADWSLPHFEKMLYDNAQLLSLYLDAFLGLPKPDPELLGVVYDLAAYLLSPPIAAPGGGFYSSQDADSFYRKGDKETREGAYYVWTARELETLLPAGAYDIVAAFFGVNPDGNVAPSHDVHDEFINQNVLRIASTPSQLASQFGIAESEVVETIKSAKRTLLAHREAERVVPNLDDKIVCAWNGIAIGALARTGASLREVDAQMSERCLDAAIRAARFMRREMYDEDAKTLRRVWRGGPGETAGFADDYAFLVEGLLELYEATFADEWVRWADELQATQNSHFLDPTASGFFATAAAAPHTILRLKDGMDASEPSTNGVSASNLFRLASLLGDDKYEALAKETVGAFEAEIMQYPWLFGSFMPSVVAGLTGVRGVVRVGAKEPLVEGVRVPGDGAAAAATADEAAVTAVDGTGVDVPAVGTGVPVPEAVGAETATIPAAVVAGADASTTGVTTGVTTAVADAVMDASTNASATTAPTASPLRTTIPPTDKQPFHPIALDTTPSGGLVEAGETPHPSSKTGTKLPPWPRPRAKGGIETVSFVGGGMGGGLG
ncbi:hypothetical protein VC83_04954 [Pseudogymnoascus destructans]|uniref:Spermatogenesis-associated protein 20-like TRX domain-containing protein n=1 Tax=Pseudogymnoascus destructans TaxID=655981 RepID=A0A177AA33_9PEZI|nr:uncharacterized protein VC83_04954 [Pseudogymnoascus destructans]OAF58610.1 hypothetical protein VC83_04954 [Pseudogymnoascus destructans]